MQTPQGRGGIAVIALSGPKAEEILARAFRPIPSHAEAAADWLQLGHLVDGDRAIDEAIVARRGDAVEINIHGGPAAAATALHLLGRLGATVLPAPAAAPGSFPRAHPEHDNGAVGVEMLQALPRAHSLRVVAALTQQWSGGISVLARRALATPDASTPAALRAAAGRLTTMRQVLHPAEVVLAGPPNAGKSTLANALVGREVSIVQDVAGTTRDWVRELALLEGLPVYLTDTAGLWGPPQATDVDAEALRRARHRIQQADVVLLLSAGEPAQAPAWLRRQPSNGAAPQRILRVATKCDVHAAFGGADAAVAALTGEGLDVLSQRILQALDLADFDAAVPAAFTQRQADLLARAAEALDGAAAGAAREALTELLTGPVPPAASEEP
jgi:tRNA modification GTPase